MVELPDMPPGATVARLLRCAAQRLPGESAHTEAELLMAQALGRTRAWLYAHGSDAVLPAQVAAFEQLLARRLAGTPVAHLIGTREFWSLQLKVSEETLIPRPETELLVELALDRIPTDAPLRVLDLGTGSGAIALALAHERPSASVTAIDRDPLALAMARRNAGALRLPQVRLLCGSWFAPVAGERFDLVVSNPPYIADSDPHLREGDLRFEPLAALASGIDGLDAIREIVASSPAYLQPGGRLLIEHGYRQAAEVRALLDANGFVEVRTWQDLESRDRVSGGQLSGSE